ncbi:MAG: homoserine dehydrogenase [Nitrososphaeria archaeon]
MRYNLAFIGFGVVGQGLAHLLDSKRSDLRARDAFEYEVVAVSDLKLGAVYDRDGLDLGELLRLAKGKKSLSSYSGGVKGLSALDSILKTNCDVVVEATWTNLKDGEPGLTHIRTALEKGKHVVTSNKGPIALRYRELVDLAKERRVMLRFEATVLSGTPALNLGCEALAGAGFAVIRGILNGTTNYILTCMEEGVSYEVALKKAQELGYAEADPTADVEAWDPAAKVTILANVLMDGNVDVSRVEREGITEVSTRDIDEARQAGMKIKLIAKAWREDGTVLASVKPERILVSDPLSNVGGVLNAITFSSDVQKDVTVIGPGAGGGSAGFALLSDLLAINRLESVHQ